MPHSVNNGAACAFQKHILVFTSDRQLFTYNPSNRIWSSIFLKSSSKLGYRAALPWRNFIFLVDYGSNRVYKYSPDEHLVQEYGIFHFPPINVCIVDDKLYNFSHDDMDNHVLEVLDIVDDLPGVCDSKESSFDRNDENKHDESTKDNGKLRVAVAKEMWREGHDGPHIFTTKYPADATFSLGCFPLMKLL
ncbi:hypothetical protein SK128_005043 [Halocaridina rubra]|uniref:Uncharacterized protein n=1 Tax=Halocaridina rubra TaxID=373956 RepID=A0AAN8XW26_HALRR